MQKKITKNILDKCFWDYNFTEKDILEIINSPNKEKEKKFLFGKIIESGGDILNDLTIFNEDDLALLIKSYKVPQFNFDYINQRYLIVKNFFLNEKVDIPELEWKI